MFSFPNVASVLGSKTAFPLISLGAILLYLSRHHHRHRRIDRLSALPDGVLCHILSFLPTHDAVATSLLSKRWQHLWLSVPALDLDDQAFLRNRRPFRYFFRFAYAAILSRSPRQSLTRFRLNSRNSQSYRFESHFQVWVNAVVRHGLQHLHIDVPLDFKLPSTVFTCKTLVVLELSLLCVVTPVGPVHLPALKTLRLYQVTLSETRYLVELLRGCPILEDLRANRVRIYRNWEDAVGFQSMPKLLRADISICTGPQIPLKALCNVEYLRFYLEVNIDWKHGRVLFNQECFPVFHNLIHLELIFERYVTWHWVFEMLEFCPKLQTFVLHKLRGIQSPPKIWSCPLSVPECISSQIRKCNIVNYEGKECELQFAKYIMQNSRALQTMTIHILTIENAYSSNPRDKLEMQQELAMCPRSSATCKLLFK